MIWYRLHTKLLLKYLEIFPVVALVGPRQVGKSTLALSKEIGKEREYYTLDDFEILDTAKNEPSAIVRQDKLITIDEVQKCPTILVEIKKQVDRKRKTGKYLITGSADLSLYANLSKTLSGRVGIIELPPLSWWEIEEKKRTPWIINLLNKEKKNIEPPDLKKPNYKHDLEKMILKGGYPLAAKAKTINEAHIWHESYKQTYLEREVRQLTEVHHLTEFAKLLTLCSARTAQVLNQADLARDAGLPQMTLFRYLNLLESTFQIKRLQPYYSNIPKRQVKSPKLFWYDTGIATHLLNLNSFESIIKHNLLGQILETFVILQIENYLKALKPEARLFFWRTHTGLEVDGLIIDGLYKLPFEVKASSNVQYNDARGLREFIKTNKFCYGGIIFYMGNEVKLLGENIWGVPISGLLE